MTPILILAFCMLVLATSFIAGVFGMAGGMLLMGGLLFMVPVADAMVLHGITQMTSNGWRSLLWRRYIIWSIVGRYMLGLVMAGVLFWQLSFAPDEGVIFIFLGLTPFIGRAIPAYLLPQATKPGGAELCGFISTSLQLFSGVSGPLIDMFFARSELDRRKIVATKAACQVVTHFTKLLYFGVLIKGASDIAADHLLIVLAMGFAIIGTTLARSLLERLSDQNFRRYTWRLLLGIGVIYLVRGLQTFTV
jgi:uncharacterized membrane protein YfcA